MLAVALAAINLLVGRNNNEILLGQIPFMICPFY